MPFKLTLIHESRALNITSSRSSIPSVIGLKCLKKKIEKVAFGCSVVNLLKCSPKLMKTTRHLITIEKKGIIMYNIYVNDIHF